MAGLAATLISTACLAAVPAHAATERDVTESFSSAYQACTTYGETHVATAIPAAECDARELRLQDGRLNAVYKAVVARLSPVRRADLREDERDWITARDRKCNRRPDPDLKTECQIDETIKRVAYLRRYR